MKTTGKEWKKFYDDESIWPDGTWHEEVVILINGKEITDEDAALDLLLIIKDTDIIDIKGGVVYSDDTSYHDGKGQSLVSMFRKWKRKQEYASMVITFKVADRDRVMAILKENRIKIEA